MWSSVQRRPARAQSACARADFFAESGATVVMGNADEPKVLAENTLTIGEARPYGNAATDRTFLPRTGRELICVRRGV